MDFSKLLPIITGNSIEKPKEKFSKEDLIQKLLLNMMSGNNFFNPFGSQNPNERAIAPNSMQKEPNNSFHTVEVVKPPELQRNRPYKP